MIPITVVAYDKPTARGHVWVGTIRQGELARDGELKVEQSSCGGDVEGQHVAILGPYVESDSPTTQQGRQLGVAHFVLQLRRRTPMTLGCPAQTPTHLRAA